jgi:hypothetical protein
MSERKPEQSEELPRWRAEWLEYQERQIAALEAEVAATKKKSAALYAVGAREAFETFKGIIVWTALLVLTGAGILLYLVVGKGSAKELAQGIGIELIGAALVFFILDRVLTNFIKKWENAVIKLETAAGLEDADLRMARTHSDQGSGRRDWMERKKWEDIIDRE